MAWTDTKVDNVDSLNASEYNALATAVKEIAASYIVYKDGSTYYARNGVTGVLYSNSDAKTVIQYAIDALTGGGTILIKSGVYSLTAPIKPTTGITIMGEGMGTTLYAANSMNDHMIMNKNIVSNQKTDSFITIRDIQLDGNGLNQGTVPNPTPCGIWISNADNIQILNVRIVNPRSYCVGFARTGTGFISTQFAVLAGCKFERNNASFPLYDLVAIEAQDTVVANNLFYNANGAGLTTANSNRVEYTGNSIYCTDCAINLEGQSLADYVSIIGNNIQSKIGVTLGGSANNITIIGNNINPHEPIGTGTQG